MDSASRQNPQRNLHGRIVHALGRRILRGDISPGDALEAGSVMAASRTALREAIRVLAAKGLVVARPRIGTRVTRRRVPRAAAGRAPKRKAVRVRPPRVT